MEEIEFPPILSSYFYTYVLCQSIFALSNTVLNSLTLSAHLIPLPTLPSCFLFTVNIVDQKSNPFIWNCLKKLYHPIGHHCGTIFSVNTCVCAIYVCISLIHMCKCLMHSPTSLKSADFHPIVWWVKKYVSIDVHLICEVNHHFCLAQLFFSFPQPI